MKAGKAFGKYGGLYAVRSQSFQLPSKGRLSEWYRKSESQHSVTLHNATNC